jgi:hypothetical protein
VLPAYPRNFFKPPIRSFKLRFEDRVRLAQHIYNGLPLEILLFAFVVPVGWRAGQNDPQVGILSAKLIVCARTESFGGVLDLKPLPFSLGWRLVIRDFEHQGGYVPAESLCQFLCREIGIFNNVVQKRRSNEISVRFPGQPSHPVVRLRSGG